VGLSEGDLSDEGREGEGKGEKESFGLVERRRRKDERQLQVIIKGRRSEAKEKKKRRKTPN